MGTRKYLVILLILLSACSTLTVEQRIEQTGIRFAQAIANGQYSKAIDYYDHKEIIKIYGDIEFFTFFIESYFENTDKLTINSPPELFPVDGSSTVAKIYTVKLDISIDGFRGFMFVRILHELESDQIYVRSFNFTDLNNQDLTDRILNR
jgi:hypothetical protein